MTAAAPAPTPAQILFQTVCNVWIAKAIWLAAKLGVADLIAEGVDTDEKLAAATGTQVRQLRRVMRALAAEGFFTQSGGRYALTDLAQPLRANHPQSQRAFIDALLDGEQMQAWDCFEDAVRTGAIAFQLRHGMQWFEFFEKYPERGRLFGEAMTASTRQIEDALLAAHDFGAFKLGIDLGGSHASFIGKLLERQPSARGIVFDLPETLAAGKAIWSSAPFASRLEAMSGDFFKEVPAGGDLYTLKFILHDWTDEQSALILSNIRRAIAPGGRVALIEMLIPEDGSPSPAYAMDLNMLAMTGGRERTGSEYCALLHAAGFRDAKVTKTGAPMDVVEARA